MRFDYDSAFSKHKVTVEIQYNKVTIETDDKRLQHKFTVVSGLVSALIRSGANMGFIIDEISNIPDPGGSSYKAGIKYISIYDELAKKLKGINHEHLRLSGTKQ